MAEAVMKRMLRRHGRRFRVESAATHDYLVGMPPDPTAVTVARQRGYDLTAIRARRICREDFDRFDLIVAMDFSNYKSLRAASRAHRAKVRLLMDFPREAPCAEVPDPFNCDRSRYFLALDLIEMGCKALVQRLNPSRKAA
jgi:protein-tyrosine phosphatase